MTRDEYRLLFHELGLNRVAFMRLMDCDEAVLKLVNAAVEQEREALAKYFGHIEVRVDDKWVWLDDFIRARGEPTQDDALEDAWNQAIK
jgi:hypothetical protein